MDSGCPTPLRIVDAERFIMKLTEQSELKSRLHRRAYECSTASTAGKARSLRIARANWWVGQMRRAVEQACPSEVNRTRVEQRTLPLASQ